MNTLADITQRLSQGGTLSREEARSLMDLLVSGESETDSIIELLRALNTQTRTVEEMTGLAEGMRSKAVTVRVDRIPLIDTCGTGGDGLQTFNISTASAFVVAGAGVAVAKHGNRSVSSKSGSTDVLEKLGVPVDLPPDSVRDSIEKNGFGFFFAPHFHPALKTIGQARRAFGKRTVFNLLGPMGNPALVRRQIVGIFDGSLLETYARVLLRLGAEHVLVVRGEDGMDEFSLSAPTRVCRADAHTGVRFETVNPEDVGLQSCPPEALRGGDAAENARLMKKVLAGEPGPLLDATLYNAGAGLVAAGAVSNYKEGVRAARGAVASGKAQAVLEAIRSGDAA